MDIRHIFRRFHHQQIIPAAEQLGQPRLPNGVQPFLPRQLSVVVERGVQRDMGIRHIVPQVCSCPKNRLPVFLVKGFNQAGMGPSDLPWQHAVGPQRVLTASGGSSAEPWRRPQCVQTGKGRGIAIQVMPRRLPFHRVLPLVRIGGMRSQPIHLLHHPMAQGAREGFRSGPVDVAVNGESPSTA